MNFFDQIGNNINIEKEVEKICALIRQNKHLEKTLWGSTTHWYYKKYNFISAIAQKKIEVNVCRKMLRKKPYKINVVFNTNGDSRSSNKNAKFDLHKTEKVHTRSQV